MSTNDVGTRTQVASGRGHHQFSGVCPRLWPLLQRQERPRNVTSKEDTASFLCPSVPLTVLPAVLAEQRGQKGQQLVFYVLVLFLLSPEFTQPSWETAALSPPGCAPGRGSPGSGSFSTRRQVHALVTGQRLGVGWAGHAGSLGAARCHPARSWQGLRGGTASATFPGQERRGAISLRGRCLSREMREGWSSSDIFTDKLENSVSEQPPPSSDNSTEAPGG